MDEVLKRAKAKIANSQAQKKAVAKEKKRRNSVRDKIRKNVSRGRLQIGTNQKPSSSTQDPSSPKVAPGGNLPNVTIGDKSTSGKSTTMEIKCEESSSLIRKDDMEKVTTASHLKVQFIGLAELPKLQPPYKSRKSSFPLRKHQDNDLGYNGRKYHRHVHQKRREKEYFAYKNGMEYRSSPSDFESD
ncbi:unnamed protein product [Orchesella dallaii]|uniref:Uncharacterized protein n=1 Tax=Orchesella dallaii TaxID=48710 RepID=A0ABP1QBV1_9HEXA